MLGHEEFAKEMSKLMSGHDEFAKGMRKLMLGHEAFARKLSSGSHRPESVDTASPNEQRSTMDPRLLEAATKGDSGCIIKLEGEDPNLLTGANPIGNTALHIAAMLGHEEFAEQICKKKPELVASSNSQWQTPFHLAAITGSLPMVSLFIENLKEFAKSDTEQGAGCVKEVLMLTNSNGDTALHEALRNGHTSVALELLKEAPELSKIVNKSFESPLYMAAVRGFHEIVEKLLQCDSCEVGGPLGETALHAAALIGHLAIARTLVDERKELCRAKNCHGRTALHYAARKGFLELVQLMLKHDASLAYALDKNVEQPLAMAVEVDQVRIIQEIMQWCPDSGNTINKWGENPLHIAIAAGRANVVEYILKTPMFQTIINQPDYKGNTPIHRAALKNDLKILRILLRDKRVDRTALNRDGETALTTFYNKVEPTATIQWNETLQLLVDAIPNENSNLLQGRSESHLTKKMIKQIESLTKTYTNNTTVVATLMATVTFAAAFTVPGGYNGNAGLGQGLPILAKKAAFKAFLISNTIALCSSLAVAFLCIFVARNDMEYLIHYKATTRKLMWCAFIGLSVAFATGMYAVVATDALWIAIFLCILCCILPFLTYVLARWPVYSLRLRLQKPSLKLLENL